MIAFENKSYHFFFFFLVYLHGEKKISKNYYIVYQEPYTFFFLFWIKFHWKSFENYKHKNKCNSLFFIKFNLYKKDHTIFASSLYLQGLIFNFSLPKQFLFLSFFFICTLNCFFLILSVRDFDKKQQKMRMNFF